MKKGFTLVELVIVIAIVIVLSVVSVPIYRSYVDKAKMAEAYALLGTILTAQKAYYSEYGNFIEYNMSLEQTCNNPILGIDARGNQYSTWFWVGTNVGHPKYSFAAAANKPADLVNNGKYYLMLLYNLTSGSKYMEGNGNSDYDYDWL